MSGFKSRTLRPRDSLTAKTFAGAKPIFSVSAINLTPGNSVSIAAAEPSFELLSTTTISKETSLVSACVERKHSENVLRAYCS